MPDHSSIAGRKETKKDRRSNAVLANGQARHKIQIHILNCSTHPNGSGTSKNGEKLREYDGETRFAISPFIRVTRGDGGKGRLTSPAAKREVGRGQRLCVEGTEAGRAAAAAAVKRRCASPRRRCPSPRRPRDRLANPNHTANLSGPVLGRILGWLAGWLVNRTILKN